MGEKSPLRSYGPVSEGEVDIPFWKSSLKLPGHLPGQTSLSKMGGERGFVNQKSQCRNSSKHAYLHCSGAIEKTLNTSCSSHSAPENKGLAGGLRVFCSFFLEA